MIFFIINDKRDFDLTEEISRRIVNADLNMLNCRGQSYDNGSQYTWYQISGSRFRFLNVDKIPKIDVKDFKTEIHKLAESYKDNINEEVYIPWSGKLKKLRFSSCRTMKTAPAEYSLPLFTKTAWRRILKYYRTLKNTL